MALIFNGNLPKISGNIKIEVPTPTYSGAASSNAADSINPYTSQGPGAGGGGLTKEEIEDIRSGNTGHFYQSIIDTYASVVYVDISGNDITGDGAVGTPVATLKGALDLLPTGGAVVFNPGTHVMNDGPSSVSDGRSLYDRGIAFGFFGTPNQTILESDNGSKRDAHAYGCFNDSTETYGMIFHNEVGSRIETFTVAMISRTSTKVAGSIYNCAFASHNVSHNVVNASLYYNNNNSNNISIFNCSFLAAGWFASWTPGASTGTSMDDIAASGLTFRATEGAQTNTVTGITFDADWHITSGGSDSSNGVYSGVNAWT